MGSSPVDPSSPAPEIVQWDVARDAYRPPRFVQRDRRGVHAALLLLTVATTTQAGALHYLGFVTGFAAEPPAISWVSLAAHGLWYSVTLLAILGCHELGHYYACRYYDIDASRPYFLPVPFLLTGTLGAFIRIREPITTKRALFDIGIAGPIAGFVVAVPALLVGMHLSTVARVPDSFQGDLYELGEPLLFKAVSYLTFGSVPDGFTVNLHPMAFAAWFGFLATALNLFPIGQFDGGHICYAVLGRRSARVTLAMIPCLVALSFTSTSWVAWTVLTIVLLATFGFRHPPTLDEDVPLDPTRRRLAGAALGMFVLCFTPAPISPAALIPHDPPGLEHVERVHVDTDAAAKLAALL
jgi:membrane-associated protease RseP (regulator of RpoE activity)